MSVFCICGHEVEQHEANRDGGTFCRWCRDCDLFVEDHRLASKWKRAINEARLHLAWADGVVAEKHAVKS